MTDKIRDPISELLKKQQVTIKSQAKEIEVGKTYSSGLEGIIREQKKEIEHLNEKYLRLAKRHKKLKGITK